MSARATTPNPKALAFVLDRLGPVFAASMARGAHSVTTHCARADFPFDIAASISWRGSKDQARKEMILIQASAAALGYKLEGDVDLDTLIPSGSPSPFPADAHMICLMYKRAPVPAPRSKKPVEA